MEQEHGTHQRHHDEFQDELVAQVVHGALDELRAVIGGHDLHARGQAVLQLRQAFLDGTDGGQGVLPRAHHHHGAGHLALTVELGDTTPHLRPDAHLGHVTQQDGGAAFVHRQQHLAQVVDALQVAGGAHHVLGLGHLQHRAAALLVGGANGGGDLPQLDAEGTQPVGIHHHLVLLHHAADGGHLGHARHRLQFELEEPVLQGTQLRQVVLARAVHQGVVVHPADAGSVRPEAGTHPLRQALARLVQVFQHPRARPVEIGAVLEQHVDIGIAEEGIAAHGGGARHRQHGGGQGIGDLVLHHPWRLAGEGRTDDDLHIGQVGDGIQRHGAHGDDAPGHQQHRQQHDQEAILDRPADQFDDHVITPSRGSNRCGSRHPHPVPG